MENNFLTKNVLEKLEQKIAIDEFCKKEKIRKKSIKYLKGSLMAKVASFIIAVGLLGGNVYTFATYNQDLFSFAIQRLGILDVYDDNKQIVNITEENSKGTLTITDYAIDANNIIIGYKLVLKEESKDLNINFFESTKIETQEETYLLSYRYRDYKSITKISDTEYEIYRIYDINSKEINNKRTMLNSEVSIFTQDNELIGIWNLNIKLNTENINNEYREFNVNAEEIELNNPVKTKIEIIGVEQTNLLTKIIFNFKDPFEDWLGDYTIEIRDENGNVILNPDEQYILEEAQTYGKAVIGTDLLTSKIKIIIYEKDGHKGILSQGSTILDFDKHLVKKENSKPDYETVEYKDIKIVYNQELASVRDSYNGFDFELYKIFNEEKYFTQCIFVKSEELKEEVQNLKTFAEDIVKLKSFYNGEGIDIFADTYTLYMLTDSEDFPNCYEFSKEEALRIANGETIEKYGIKFNKTNVSYADCGIGESKEMNINGIDMVKWTDENELVGVRNNYIFIVNGQLYSIIYDNVTETNDLAEEIIYSIEINK